MRGLVLLIIVALIAVALLVSNANKPFETRIDAQSPGVWPKYAEAPTMPSVILCRPLLIGQPVPKPISRT